MTTQRKIIIAAIALAVAIALIITFIVASSNGSTETEPTVSPSPTSSANITPSESPSVEPSPSAGTLETEDGLDLPGGDIVDTRPFRDLASAGTLAYMTVNAGESVGARAARLAPYFPAGSPYLTEPPRIANPSGQEAVTADVRATSDPAAAAVPEEGDGTLTFDVIIDYQANYDGAGQKMSVTKIATWKVTMNAAFDGVIQEIVEPTDLR